jgi:hypothetical protein
MFVCPAVVGAGKRFFPDRVPLKLELVDQHRFRNGVGRSAVRSPWLVRSPLTRPQGAGTRKDRSDPVGGLSATLTLGFLPVCPSYDRNHQ